MAEALGLIGYLSVLGKVSHRLRRRVWTVKTALVVLEALIVVVVIIIANSGLKTLVRLISIIEHILRRMPFGLLPQLIINRVPHYIVTDAKVFSFAALVDY